MRIDAVVTDVADEYLQLAEERKNEVKVLLIIGSPHRKEYGCKVNHRTAILR